MHTVSENQCGKYALLLQQARTEAQADAATRFSSHLSDVEYETEDDE